MISQYGYQQPGNNISVAFINNGLQGAQSYTVGAGNTVFIFDLDNKHFFIKEVASNGFPQPIRQFNFEELIQQGNSDFVTKKEFNELKEFIENRFSNMEVNGESD